VSVLITGGHGHIGSWAAYYLAQAGEDVILFDVNPNAPDYLAEVADKITFYQGDVLDYARMQEIAAAQNGQIDGIIHTVGVMGPMVPENPHKNVTLNVAGTINALELAREFDIPKVVYTSTGAVYKPVPGIVTEDAEVEPSDLYGSTKASAELIGQHYAQTFGFEFRVCRVYFLYGPGKIPSNFIRLYQMAFGVLEGMPDLKMEAGATQKLDFTYIQDAARGTVQLYRAENLPQQVYNIATGQATSIAEVIAIAKRHTHFPVDVEIGPGDLMSRAEALDISRAQRDLGYEPEFLLDEGIKIYADWIQTNKS
jgi:nucleoside-diphosphate-sugar epimerase